ncbi:hypothetical protein D3C78_977280 [compost metagenome]
MLRQALGQRPVVTIVDVDRQQFCRFTAGLGFLARDRRCRPHDMLGGVDDVLMAAVVVAEHHPRGTGGRELLVELHEVFGRTATPAIDRLPVIAHTQQ